MPTSPAGAPLSPAGTAARRHDPERFLAALTAPADRREAIFAVLALEHEIARTREVVSEAMLGEIRLQWWDDAIAAIEEGRAPPHSEIGPALRDTIITGGVSAATLHGMIAARRRDLDDEPPSSLDELAEYARSTGGAVARATAEALDCDEASRQAAVEVGTAWALVGILRALPFRAQHHQVFLPADLMGEASLSPHDVAAGHARGRLEPIIRAVAGLAEDRIAAARRARPGRRALPVLLPARLARAHLRRLARAGHDPFAGSLQLADGWRALRIAWGAWTGRWW